MNTEPTPLPRRLAEASETSRVLDPVARALDPAADAVAAPPLGRLLRGELLGHAAHPLLTDLPLGLWVSSSVLDLVGTDPRSADRLLGLGILAAAPTALTGLADWQRGGETVRAVGALHATLNTGALALYTASWVLRKRGARRGTAVALSLLAAGATAVSGYLGGHMLLVLGAPHEQRSDVAPEPPDVTSRGVASGLQ